MNDLEINIAVAKKLGYKVSCPVVGVRDKIWITSEEKNIKGENQFEMFDPCNEWKDGGPIIEKYKISLMWCEDIETWSTVKAGDDTTINDVIYNSNPLRAVMLCFLEMEI